MRLTTTVKKGLAVMAVAAVSFIGVSSMVNAAETTGTLNIHKYTKTGDNGKVAGTGATSDEGNKGTGKPVEGVEFIIAKIAATGDLSTNAQLKTAAEIQKAFESNRNVTITNLTYGTSGAKVTFESSKTYVVKTDNMGLATKDKLERGLYYIRERSVSGAKVDNKTVQVTPAEPFMVSIPFGDKMTVDVYPKNQVSEDTTKVPDFSDLKNNKVTYTVTAFLPKKPEGGFTKFDLLDKPGTAFNASSFKLKSVKAIDKNTPTPVKKEWNLGDGLSPNGLPNDSISVTEDRGVINCSFKSTQGLQELGAASDAGANQVIYTYTLDLSPSFVSTGGVVENKALVVPSPISSTDIDGGGTGSTPPPGVVVDTKKLVNLKIKKQDGSDQTPLEGAKFNIYSCDAPVKSGDDTTQNYKNAEGRKVARAQAQQWNKSELTSQSNGETTGVLVTESTKVCITETKAPSSKDATPYVLLPEDTVVTTNTVNDGADNTQQTVTVDNYKRNFNFALPMTGANTAIVLSLSGLALIIAAAVLRMRRAKN